MTLTVMGMFRNESWIMNEWIQHYKNEGATQFILIDNDSTDDWRKTIREEYLTDKNIIWTELHGNVRDQQVRIYNECLNKYKPKTDWILPIDFDELLYSRKGFKTIVEYLDTLPKDISQVKVPWKLFGSSGLVDHPESVAKSFVYMDPDLVYDEDREVYDESHVKSIARVSSVISLNIHAHKIKSGKSIVVSGKDVEDDMRPWVPYEDIDNNPLHCNHYFTQSEQYFREKQIMRAGGNNPNWRKDMNWFNENKDKYTFDDELATKTYG